MGIFDSIFGKKPKPPAPRIMKQQPNSESQTGNIDDELAGLNLGEPAADGKNEFDDDDDDKPAKPKPKK
jgi:hypothetical protein